MFRKFSTAILCTVLLLSFIACGKDETRQSGSELNQTDLTTTSNISSNKGSTMDTTSTTSTNNNTLDNDSVQDSGETNITAENTVSVFKTDNVTRITFYKYCGNGKGSDVPAEHLNKIITWLDSFEIDTNKEFPELVPPGTNTIHVEIEYSDGSIIKQGMDTTTVDGVTYYIKGATPPECYDEIISKTSLSYFPLLRIAPQAAIKESK